MSETKDKFGVGFRPQHYAWVTTHCPRDVDVFEIVSENFMGVGGRPRYFLEKLRENYPIIMHGVGMSIGSKGPLDRQYLEQLRELCEHVQPDMVSDHLCWTQLGQRNSHDLLPIAYTRESMDDIVGKLNYIQDFLGRRFYLENPSAYVAFQDADYDEAGFFAELLKRTGAGILLDINNLYVNQRNLNLDPLDYLRALRPQDIGYFHLAGHSDQGDVLVDTHDHPVPDAVWSLYRKTQSYFPGVPAIVEWDGNIPEFPVLLEECAKARQHSALARSDKGPLLPPRSVASIPTQVPNEKNYTKFFGQLIRPHGISEDGLSNLNAKLPVPAATGLKVYNHAYFLRLEEVMADTFRSLAFIAEEEGFRYILTAYLDRHPPMGPNIRTVGEALPYFLCDPETAIDFDFGVPLALLGDLAALEWARSLIFAAMDSENLVLPQDLASLSPELWESVRFTTIPATQLVSCNYDVLPVLLAIDQDEVPSPPEEKDVHYLVFREDFAVHEQVLSIEEKTLLQAFQQGASLGEACAALSDDTEVVIPFVASKLMAWSGQGWLTWDHKPLNRDVEEPRV